MRSRVITLDAFAGIGRRRLFPSIPDDDVSVGLDALAIHRRLDDAVAQRGYDEHNQRHDTSAEVSDGNGHIHRRLEDAPRGGTLWVTPGNISRRNRGDATREHTPAVLRIDVTESGYVKQWVEVPHRPFEEVFHEEVIESASELGSSAFVAGLAELQSRRTDTGAGLMVFLDNNLGQFDDAVADEIRQLAREVTSDGEE